MPFSCCPLVFPELSSPPLFPHFSPLFPLQALCILAPLLPSSPPPSSPPFWLPEKLLPFSFSLTSRDVPKGLALKAPGRHVRPATLQKCGSELFLPFFSATFGVTFGVTFSVLRFPGFGCAREISPKFHVKKSVKKTESFTQISVCWGAALTSCDVIISGYVRAHFGRKRSHHVMGASC